MKLAQFILSFSICFGFFSFAFAQIKPAALKFDEFTTASFEPYNLNKLGFRDRVIRLAKEILKEKDSKAYIISYNQRKGKFPLDKGDEWNKSAIEILTNTPYAYVNPEYQVPSERVVSINGGYREYASVEFWIVPLGAELPKPIPTFDKTEIAVCPEINVASDGFRHDRTQPLKFSVAIKGEEPDSKLSLEWNVSAGEIVDGQGTSQIKIDLNKTDVKQITASVQVKGLNPECNNHSFRTTTVGSFPYKIDEFYYAPHSELRREWMVYFLILIPSHQ